MVTPQMQKVGRSEKKKLENAIFKRFNNLNTVTPKCEKLVEVKKINLK
jgi:hypothetical protein